MNKVVNAGAEKLKIKTNLYLGIGVESEFTRKYNNHPQISFYFSCNIHFMILSLIYYFFYKLLNLLCSRRYEQATGLEAAGQLDRFSTCLHKLTLHLSILLRQFPSALRNTVFLVFWTK
jgi:hypothetical protein